MANRKRCKRLLSSAIKEVNTDYCNEGSLSTMMRMWPEYILCRATKGLYMRLQISSLSVCLLLGWVSKSRPDFTSASASSTIKESRS